MAFGLLDKDYSDIDRELLGKETISEHDIVRPDPLIAPAQGYAFLDAVVSLKSMMSKYRSLYSD